MWDVSGLDNERGRWGIITYKRVSERRILKVILGAGIFGFPIVILLNNMTVFLHLVMEGSEHRFHCPAQQINIRQALQCDAA